MLFRAHPNQKRGQKIKPRGSYRYRFQIRSGDEAMKDLLISNAFHGVKHGR
jgi:hypothetical protein